MEEKKVTFKEIFNTLSALNLNEYIEKKKSDNGTELSYVSWASALEVLLKHYPNSTYEIHEEAPNRMCFYDEDLGYLVKTSVTVEGHTRSMSLPVMNYANKIMFDHQYKYTVRGTEKTVEAATYFDINTNVMRCLVKNLALFGLGIYVYRGEDLPSEEAKEFKKKKSEAEEKIMPELQAAQSAEEVEAIKAKYADEISKYPDLRQAFLDKCRQFNPFA